MTGTGQKKSTIYKTPDHKREGRKDYPSRMLPAATCPAGKQCCHTWHRNAGARAWHSISHRTFSREECSRTQLGDNTAGCSYSPHTFRCLCFTVCCRWLTYKRALESGNKETNMCIAFGTASLGQAVALTLRSYTPAHLTPKIHKICRCSGARVSEEPQPNHGVWNVQLIFENPWGTAYPRWGKRYFKGFLKIDIKFI